MANKRTPGPWIVERAVETGYRGGRKSIGWRVRHEGSSAPPHLRQFKTTALALAEELNQAGLHRTLPWKVEGREYSNGVRRSVLIGRAMFKTREEAEQYAAGNECCRVLPSKPGDTEFA